MGSNAAAYTEDGNESLQTGEKCPWPRFSAAGADWPPWSRCLAFQPVPLYER